MERVLSVLSAIVAGMGITWGIAGVSLVGAGLSLFSLNPETATLKTRATTLFGGLGLGVVGAPQIGSYMELEQKTIVGVALVVSLFGLIFLKELYSFLNHGGATALLGKFLKQKGVSQNDVAN